MTSAAEQQVRARLVARRERLAALTGSRRERRLVGLLRRVDEALATLEVESVVACTVCHEALSAERLSYDPLVRVCLECLSVEERRALERDLEAAARVQRALLPPTHTRHDGWEVSYLWQPRGAVSGDHVDLVRPRGENEPLHLLLGDVVGKGVAASLLQSHLHALFRALASADVPLAELLARANRLFYEATGGASYASLIVVRLHLDGRVEMANAGHPRPLLADARGVRPVEGAGVPLGLFSAAAYESRDLRLAAGQTLLLYTDGWTEAGAGGAEEDEFGIGRAAAALRRAGGLPAPELLAACRDAAAGFVGEAGFGDDLTLVALRRRESN
jgi:sigma-B regulation protein RsbU (phosphoserine phosphatase)